jgi:uncharacterized membrane protein (DUF373 family)
MNAGSRSRTILRGFETTVVVAVGLILSLAVAIAVLMLYVFIFQGLRTNLAELESVTHLQVALQNVFGGVLLVLLGLELIDTLKIYFIDHEIRTEVILVVAMIAVGRHIIQVDFHHTEGLELIGMGAITIALAASYFLVKKARGYADDPPPITTPQGHPDGGAGGRTDAHSENRSGDRSDGRTGAVQAVDGRG